MRETFEIFFVLLCQNQQQCIQQATVQLSSQAGRSIAANLRPSQSTRYQRECWTVVDNPPGERTLSCLRFINSPPNCTPASKFSSFCAGVRVCVLIKVKGSQAMESTEDPQQLASSGTRGAVSLPCQPAQLQPQCQIRLYHLKDTVHELKTFIATDQALEIKIQNRADICSGVELTSHDMKTTKRAWLPTNYLGRI